MTLLLIFLLLVLVLTLWVARALYRAWQSAADHVAWLQEQREEDRQQRQEILDWNRQTVDTIHANVVTWMGQLADETEFVVGHEPQVDLLFDLVRHAQRQKRGYLEPMPRVLIEKLEAEGFHVPEARPVEMFDVVTWATEVAERARQPEQYLLELGRLCTLQGWVQRGDWLAHTLAKYVRLTGNEGQAQQELARFLQAWRACPHPFIGLNEAGRRTDEQIRQIQAS